MLKSLWPRKNQGVQPPLPDTYTKVFCPTAWNSLSMTNNGDYRICCEMIEPPWSFLKNEKGESLNAKTDSFTSLRNTDLLKELRATTLKGERHSLCKQCWTMEDAGLSSKRTSMIATFPGLERKALTGTEADGTIDPQKFPLQYFDVRFGNLCNLKCRTCSPTDSSLWLKDWMERRQEEDATPPTHLDYYNIKYEILRDGEKISLRNHPFEWKDPALFFREMDTHAQGIRQIYFTGGEPFINASHWRLLENLIAAGAASNIELMYNSNLLSLPEKAFSLWSHFRSIVISCSLDGIENYVEYTRLPSKWSVLERHLRRLDDTPEKFNVFLAPTISIFNIYHIPDMLLWFLKNDFKKISPFIWVHLLFSAEIYSCQVLPPKAKHKVMARYKKFYNEVETWLGAQASKNLEVHFAGALQHMWAKDQSHLLPQFFVECAAMDRIQNRNLREELPELWELLHSSLENTTLSDKHLQL